MKPLHLPTDTLERTLAQEWARFNKERPRFDLLTGPEVQSVPEGLDYDINTLTGGLQPYPYGRMTQRDRFIAATVIQWLGTPCGLAFLTSAFQRAGGDVVYDGYAALNESTP